ncbi:MAG TPA: hypothetical protein VNN73_10805 [Blastocatellia bacterium]|nr:hypothetical protein [Blastocatellia bacterium]
MTGLDFSRLQKALLVWTALFIILAEIVKRMNIEGRAATLVGLAELLLAIATGFAFGVAASGKRGAS